MKSLSEKHIREIMDYLFDISCKMAATKLMYNYAEENGLDINAAFKNLYMDYAHVKCDLDGLRYWLENYIDGDSNE